MLGNLRLKVRSTIRSWQGSQRRLCRGRGASLPPPRRVTPAIRGIGRIVT